MYYSCVIFAYIYTNATHIFLSDSILGDDLLEAWKNIQTQILQPLK